MSFGLREAPYLVACRRNRDPAHQLCSVDRCDALADGLDRTQRAADEEKVRGPHDQDEDGYARAQQRS